MKGKHSGLKIVPIIEMLYTIMKKNIKYINLDCVHFTFQGEDLQSTTYNVESYRQEKYTIY